MKIISFDFYWKFNKENINEIIKLIATKEFKFKPTELIYEVETSFEDGVKELINIDFYLEESINIIIRGNCCSKPARLYFNVLNWGKNKMIKILISCPIETKGEMEFINSYLKVTDLIACFIYDTEDERWQTEKNINHYVLSNMDHMALPKTKDRAGRTVIDTSLNYGRSEHSIGIKFVAGGEMFFGEIFFKIVNKHILLQIANSKECQHGNNRLIHISLFKLFEQNSTRLREAQKCFLETTGIINIAVNLKEKFSGIAQALSSLNI